jgi:hypothetical protein
MSMFVVLVVVVLFVWVVVANVRNKRDESHFVGLRPAQRPNPAVFVNAVTDQDATLLRSGVQLLFSSSSSPQSDNSVQAPACDCPTAPDQSSCMSGSNADSGSPSFGSDQSSCDCSSSFSSDSGSGSSDSCCSSDYGGN